jgi:hypothetical protein
MSNAHRRSRAVRTVVALTVLALGAFGAQYLVLHPAEAAAQGTAGSPARREANAGPTVRTAQDIARVLAPATAPATREAVFGRLEAAAQAGDATAAYVIGSLYRRGADYEGLLLVRNPGRALKWLNAAAQGGELNAFAKLAATYAEMGEPLEAMSWAQAYDYFLQNDPACRKPCTDAYATALLGRLFAALPADAEARIRDRTRALLVRVGPRFELARRRKAKDAGLEPPSYAGARYRVKATGLGSAALAEYVVRIGADGRVRDAWLLDALPALEAAAPLEPHVRALPFGAAGSERYGIVPVVFGD